MERRSFLQLIGLLSSFFFARESRSEVQGKGPRAGDLTYQQVSENLADTKIYIVPYAHSDWAWTHSRQWQEERDDLIINEVLDILRENPDFRWFFDTQNEILQPFLDRSPQRVPELKQRVKEGKVGVSGGTICNQHPHWMEGESLIWNMVLGRRYFETNFPGVNLDAMTLYDVCVGYSQLPQLLAKAGYKYYRFWRPDDGLNAKGIPRQFRWQGLDGSQIVCSRGTYGGLVSASDIPKDFATNWERTVMNLYGRVLEPIMNVPTNGFVWIANGADDTRPLRAFFPDDPAEPVLPLIPFVRAWNQREKNTLRFATPAEFFQGLSVHSRTLPIVRGVLDPCGWTYWYGMNGVNGLRLWRTLAEDALVSAEKYLALSTQFGESYPEESFERLWHALLETSSHAQNWLFEEDYEQHLDLVKSVFAQATEIEAEGLQGVAGRVRVEEPGEALVVFNPLPWDRQDVVCLHPTLVFSDTGEVEVRDAQGQLVLSQMEEVNHYENEIFVKEASVWAEVSVPAMGYTTLYVKRKARSAGRYVGRTHRVRIGPDDFYVEVGPDGTSTLVDLALQTTYSHAGEIFYQEVHDTGPLHYGPIIRELIFSVGEAELLQRGPMRWVGELRGNIGPHLLRLQIAVYPSRHRVEYLAEIDSRGGNGYFLATVIPPFTGNLFAGVPFGVEPRDLHHERYEGVERLRPNVFYAGHWVDVNDGRRGITFVGRKGEKGYIYEPDKRRLSHYLLQTISNSSEGWEHFCNPYMEGKGRQTFTYYLVSHAGSWAEANAPRNALEAEYGLRAIARKRRFPANERVLPENHSFLACPTNVFFSSLARAGDRWLLRIYEGLGKGGAVEIRLPQKFSSAKEVDFNGHTLSKEVTLHGDAVSFEIHPWEIITLELT